MRPARVRFLTLVLAVMAGLCAFGCDREQSASNESGGQPPPSRESEAESDGPLPDDADVPAAAAPKAPPVPTPDVPLPPTIVGEAAKMGFVFFSATDLPKTVGAFYQKEMEAKGWKIGRNETKNAGSNLTSVLQQYTKGNEVLTVVLLEQIGSEKNMTSALIMDIALPPSTQQVVPIIMSATMTMPEAPDAALASFARELGARGWSAQAAAESGGNKTQTHKKGLRSLMVIARAMPGNKGTSIQLQHTLGYAE